MSAPSVKVPNDSIRPRRVAHAIGRVAASASTGYSIPSAGIDDFPRGSTSDSGPRDIRPANAIGDAERDVVLHDVALESGARIAELTVRYRIDGAISPQADNVVLVVHALTGDANAASWWRGVIGDGAAIDPSRHAVLCANLLGGCSGTGVSAGETLPRFTTRDQAAVLALVLDALGVQRPVLVCGGSLGGMVTLEFAASFPERVGRAVVLAAPAAQTAQGIAWNAIMRRAIEVGGANDGFALARMVGMLSYRTPEGLERRFGRLRNNGRYQVDAWLTNHGQRLVSRFETQSYLALLDAMDTHDVGRGRGGICAALAPVRDRLWGVGIGGDLLYPAESVREWSLLSGAAYEEISSPHGHDAFLLETARVSRVIAQALDGNASRTARPYAVAAQPRPLRVALAGCGHVGGALLELLVDNPLVHNRPVEVVRVLARDGSRNRPQLASAAASGIAHDAHCITDRSHLLDGDVDVLVEAIGGIEDAHVLIRQALGRGISVITANKELIAAHGPELLQLARRRGARLDFEAAVAGAIPVVRTIRSGAGGVSIRRISAILNGTTNFVLDQIAAGASLDDAVREAQRLGFAEADPTRDLSGQDVEAKLRILAWLAFRVDPASLHIDRRGIDASTAAWAAEVAAEGDRVKLIATCERVDDTFVASIRPVRVSGASEWAAVRGAQNRVEIESDSAGLITLQGAGAGGRATAGAILGDLFSGVPA